eukprot:TRINITY_DN10214_c0_g1_i3.p1 TRINITY_DN10214_c0_g1~~TRINITY_DN10214_c0_g1_i3.p1  ORF type:complete len:616 (-),score=165.43 TRINITY_DN10214_c0_g1_i3:202-2049(-)
MPGLHKLCVAGAILTANAVRIAEEDQSIDHIHGFVAHSQAHAHSGLHGYSNSHVHTTGHQAPHGHPTNGAIAHAARTLPHQHSLMQHSHRSEGLPQQRMQLPHGVHVQGQHSTMPQQRNSMMQGHRAGSFSPPKMLHAQQRHAMPPQHALAQKSMAHQAGSHASPAAGFKHAEARRSMLGSKRPGQHPMQHPSMLQQKINQQHTHRLPAMPFQQHTNVAGQHAANAPAHALPQMHAQARHGSVPMARNAPAMDKQHHAMLQSHMQVAAAAQRTGAKAHAKLTSGSKIIKLTDESEMDDPGLGDMESDLGGAGGVGNTEKVIDELGTSADDDDMGPLGGAGNKEQIIDEMGSPAPDDMGTLGDAGNKEKVIDDMGMSASDDKGMSGGGPDAADAAEALLEQVKEKEQKVGEAITDLVDTLIAAGFEEGHAANGASTGGGGGSMDGTSNEVIDMGDMFSDDVVVDDGNFVSEVDGDLGSNPGSNPGAGNTDKVIDEMGIAASDDMGMPGGAGNNEDIIDDMGIFARDDMGTTGEGQVSSLDPAPAGKQTESTPQSIEEMRRLAKSMSVSNLDELPKAPETEENMPGQTGFVPREVRRIDKLAEGSDPPLPEPERRSA